MSKMTGNNYNYGGGGKSRTLCKSLNLPGWNLPPGVVDLSKVVAMYGH